LAISSAAARRGFCPSVAPRIDLVLDAIPDRLANPYVAFAAMLMAGADGIQNKGSIRANRLDKKPLRAAAGVNGQGCRQVPGSLEAAMSLLEKDHDFLLKGDVIHAGFFSTCGFAAKRKEHDALRLAAASVLSFSSTTTCSRGARG